MLLEKWRHGFYAIGKEDQDILLNENYSIELNHDFQIASNIIIKTIYCSKEDETFIKRYYINSQLVLRCKPFYSKSKVKNSLLYR